MNVATTDSTRRHAHQKFVASWRWNGNVGDFELAVLREEKSFHLKSRETVTNFVKCEKEPAQLATSLPSYPVKAAAGTTFSSGHIEDVGSCMGNSNPRREEDGQPNNRKRGLIFPHGHVPTCGAIRYFLYVLHQQS
jgi:hypothetical protein